MRFIGFILLMLFVFWACGLGSYTPGDLPDTLAYPVPAAVHNLCGPLGAKAASALENVLGYAAFFLLLPLGIQALRFLYGTPLNQVALRTFGFCLVLFGLSGLCGLFDERIAFLPCSRFGPGGILGVSIVSVLRQHISDAGICVLLASIVCSGIVLLGDQSLCTALKAVKVIFATINGQITGAKRSSDKSGTQKKIAAASLPNTGNNAGRNADNPSGVPDWILDKQKRLIRNRIFDQSATLHTEYVLQPPHIVQSQQPVKPMSSQGIAAETAHSVSSFNLPPLDLLVKPEPFDDSVYAEIIRSQSEQLEAALASFKLDVQVIDVRVGPVISQFELKLAKGLLIKNIQGLSDDLAMAMKVKSVRIVAPIPGRGTVGIEIPNEKRQTVNLRDIIELTPNYNEKYNLPLFLGKDVSGAPMVSDLTDMPHLLIAGRTGTGKSVCLNSIIVSLLMSRTPEQVRLIMIDPKTVEMSSYGTIPHLMYPVITKVKKAEAVLAWAVDKMEERYMLLQLARVRNINEYNKLSEADLRRKMKMNNITDEEWEVVPKKLPFMVIIADEFNDLMMVSGKDVETHIIRLAQKSRAVGIHLILATQKPTVNVVTGLIKSNLPARIAFGVATQMDSRVVLDRNGAERLLGCGDMLFLDPSSGQLIRGQGTFVSDAEIESVIDTISTGFQYFDEELLRLDEEEENAGKTSDNSKTDMIRENRDELYEDAIECVIQEGSASTSLLQRRLSIGYGRASRLMDFMTEDGIISKPNGAKAREVLITTSEWRKKSNAGNGPTSDSSILGPQRAVSSLYSSYANKTSEDEYNDEDSYVAP